MKINQTATNTNFYQQCAAILQTAHLGKPFPHYKRTRWNNRIAGQGRFEGFGIIRCFGDQVHIALIGLNKVCQSKDEALQLLSNTYAPACGSGPDATNV